MSFTYEYVSAGTCIMCYCMYLVPVLPTYHSRKKKENHMLAACCVLLMMMTDAAAVYYLMPKQNFQ